MFFSNKQKINYRIVNTNPDIFKIVMVTGNTKKLDVRHNVNHHSSRSLDIDHMCYTDPPPTLCLHLVVYIGFLYVCICKSIYLSIYLSIWYIVFRVLMLLQSIRAIFINCIVSINCIQVFYRKCYIRSHILT